MFAYFCLVTVTVTSSSEIKRVSGVRNWQLNARARRVHSGAYRGKNSSTNKGVNIENIYF